MKFKMPPTCEKPTFGTVKRVNAIVNRWIVRNVPLEKLDIKKDAKKEVEKLIRSDMNLRASFCDMMQEMESRRMVMLGKNITEAEAAKLEDLLPYDEYEAMLDEIKQILNIETVEDFLDKLKKSTSTRPEEPMMETT